MNRRKVHFFPFPLPRMYYSTKGAYVRRLTGLLLLLALLAPWRPASAQTFFENGYVVTLAGDTLHGFIDNQEWVYGPEEIAFRTDRSAETQKVTVDDIREFRVSGDVYVRRIVDLDRTPVKLGPTRRATPISQVDTLFLAVLVKGSLSLYHYADDRDHFFIEHDGTTEELIHHKLIRQVDGRGVAVTVNRYREQLRQYLGVCPELRIDLEDLDFRKRPLSSVVKQFNECTSPQTPVYARERPGIAIDAGILLGGSRSVLGAKFPASTVAFTPDLNVTAGLSISFRQSRNRGRRSVDMDVVLLPFSTRNMHPYREALDDVECSPGDEGVYCVGTKWYHEVDRIRLSVTTAKIAAGFRQEFVIRSVRPFIKLGGTLDVVVREESHVEHALFGYEYEGYSVTEVEPRYYTTDFFDVNRLGWGLLFAVGVHRHKLSAEFRAEASPDLHSSGVTTDVGSTYFLLRYILW